MKVLLCAPNQRGGVSSFCRVISDKMPATVDQFLLGRREAEQNWFSDIGRIKFVDYGKIRG